MKALTLEEHAQELRRSGDIRTADIADDILALLDLEEEVAEPYNELCGDLEHYAKAGSYDHADKPEKALEWLGDRSNLLGEIEKQLDEDGRTGDTDDQVKAMLETLEAARLIIGSPDGCSDETFLQELEEIVERAQPKDYDL